MDECKHCGRPRMDHSDLTGKCWPGGESVETIYSPWADDSTTRAAIRRGDPDPEDRR